MLATSRAGLKRMFEVLTGRIAFLTQGGPAPTNDPKFPPPDSGLLGPTILPGNLTMTVALGASLFDDRFGLQAQKPCYLTRMPSFPNDALNPDECHGDLLLQFCSNSAEINIHALRDIIKNTPDLLAVRWKQDGFLPGGAQRKETERNLLGFKDGTANLASGDAAAMDRIVWVQAGAGEPSWAAARQLSGRSDHPGVRRALGSHAAAGAGGHNRPREGDRRSPGHECREGRTRLCRRCGGKAHAARCPYSPRQSAHAGKRLKPDPPAAIQFFARVTKSGQLEMGLLFVCFQANLEKGFLAVQKRLNGEPLEEYIKPLGGGFFFALPGVRSSGRFPRRRSLARGGVKSRS